MATPEQIAAALHGFGVNFRTPVTADMTRIWLRALADVPSDALQVAVDRVIAESEFFPTPAKVRDLAGANAKPLPDMDGILRRIRGMCSYHPQYGETMPSVERVRSELGDAIANAYGFIGPKRLEAVVFDGAGVGADIAGREFASALVDAQKQGQSVTLPPARAVPQLASPSVVLFDQPPERIGQPIAKLLPGVLAHHTEDA